MAGNEQTFYQSDCPNRGLKNIERVRQRGEWRKRGEERAGKGRRAE